jgi:membrane-bound ClpP family serine protease
MAGILPRMTVFVVIGLIGLALLTASLVFGELLDGVFDALSAEWLSGAVLGGFVSAFGFGAALADTTGVSQGAVIAIGVGAGAVFAWFAAWLTRVVRSGETDGTPRTDDVIGHAATVVSSIPADGFGIVTVRIGGHVVRYNARAEAPIEPGEEVHVTGVLSPTAVTVAPPWTSLDPS